jgi:membrane-associated phospholipid phosphatase
VPTLVAAAWAPRPADPPASPPSGNTVSRRLLTVGLLCLLAEAAVYMVAVWTPLGQAYDDRVISGWRISHPAAEIEAAQALSSVQLPWVLISVALLLTIAVARRRFRLGLAVVVMVAGAIATTELLKRLVLPRPVLGAADPVLGLNSFPSGHVTVAAVLATALICVSPRSWRWPATLLGLGYAVLIGTSALFLGWHRPSDIVGGTLTAIVWAAFAAAFLAHERTSPAAPPPRHDVVGLVRHLALATAATMAAVAIAYAVIRFHETEVGAVSLTRGFWVGEAVIATSVTLALVVFDRALHGSELA